MIEPTSPPIPPMQFALRAAWVAVQIAIVFLVGRKGILFFYQAF